MRAARHKRRKRPEPPQEKTYRVIGSRNVAGVAPGGLVCLALTAEQEKRLSGHIEIVSPDEMPPAPAQAAKKPRPRAKNNKQK